MKVRWKIIDGSEQEDEVRFIGESEPLPKSFPRKLGTLRRGEKKYAVAIPRYSTDGKLDVIISGVGVRSNTQYNEHFTFNHNQSPPK